MEAGKRCTVQSSSPAIITCLLSAQQAELRTLSALREMELISLAAILCKSVFTPSQHCVHGTDPDLSFCWISAKWCNQWKQYYNSVRSTKSAKKVVSKKKVCRCV